MVSLYEALVLEDICMTADLLLPLYQASAGLGGYVRILEVSPDRAYDAAGSVEKAQWLWSAIDRPNATIKIPATQPGLEAISQLTALDVHINATLIFSPARYEAVALGWLAGMCQRPENDLPVEHVTSAASFFISRVDTLADKRLEPLATERPDTSELQGKVAVAAAKKACQRYKVLCQRTDWRQLAGCGVRMQRLLWASISTKNPAYSDVKCVDELTGSQTVNTPPRASLAAYRDMARRPCGWRGICMKRPPCYRGLTYWASITNASPNNWSRTAWKHFRPSTVICWMALSQIWAEGVITGTACRTAPYRCGASHRYELVVDRSADRQNVGLPKRTMTTDIPCQGPIRLGVCAGLLAPFS